MLQVLNNKEATEMAMKEFILSSEQSKVISLATAEEMSKKWINDASHKLKASRWVKA